MIQSTRRRLAILERAALIPNARGGRLSQLEQLKEDLMNKVVKNRFRHSQFSSSVETKDSGTMVLVLKYQNI